MFFFPKYQIRKTTFILMTFSFSIILEIFYLVKMSLIFDGSQSKSPKRYQKILCSFGCMYESIEQGYHFVSTVKLTSHRLLYRNCTNITNMWHFLKVHDSKRLK